MFLVGIIPGPKEPKKHQINHLLAPLVDDLIRFYKTGVQYSRTPNHDEGRRVRCAVVPVICDLPASRQIAGFASASHTLFCSYCYLHLQDMDNFDPEAWGERTYEDHMQHAMEWKNASSEAARTALFGASGVRYSELLRLPYWDPTRYTVIDTMHSLFLGNLKRHISDVWGMDINDPRRFQNDNASDFGTDARFKSERPKACRLHGRLSTTCKPSNSSISELGVKSLEQRIAQGWFDENDELLLPPAAGELPTINYTDGSKLLSLTVMDVDNALAYYETAEDRKSFDELTQLQLVAVAMQKLDVKLKAEEGLSDEARKTAKEATLLGRTKRTLVDGLVEQVCMQRKKDGITDDQGKVRKSDPQRFFNARSANSQRKKTRVLGKGRMQEVWNDIAKTTLPSWCTRVSPTIGDGQAGKTSADQWRIFCMIHLVITLGRLWGPLEDTSREYVMLSNFFNLLAATKIASARSTHALRAKQFFDFMLSYLRGVRELFPTYQFAQYQHIVLHLGLMLCRFGPSHAWRCWAFERYNHLLQQVNTNGRPGELEQTMFQHLCMNQRLRNVIHHAELPDSVKEIALSFDKIYKQKNRGTLLNDMLASQASLEDSPTKPTAEQAGSDRVFLAPEYVELVRARMEYESASTSSPLPRFSGRIGILVQMHTQLHRRGVTYSIYDHSPRDSYVVLGKNVPEDWRAGRIHKMFTYTRKGEEKGNTYIVVHKFKTLTETDAKFDFYRRFPLIAGRLYYEALEPDFELVGLEDIISHFAHTPYSSPDLSTSCVHVLPLDRVSDALFILLILLPLTVSQD
ncbi:hypothetical protein BV25DRAFT_1815452 [Artomyces pyxidatus]|uniref:Uncharacterized protein n=1 Tax=Artomyces pyxidatus TaxID=48021 RepID=A0ACB8SI08_9AGAM|nr:hypothetical protein BV25DRAFT_1815452 [Artomyces pyxidatus]